jgi:hypothetical protein
MKTTSQALLGAVQETILKYFPVSGVDKYLQTATQPDVLNQVILNDTIKKVALVAIQFIAIVYVAPYFIQATIIYNVVVSSVKFIDAVTENFEDKNAEKFYPVFFHFFMVLYDYSFLVLFKSYLFSIAGCTALALFPHRLLKYNEYILSYMPSEKNTNQPLFLWKPLKSLAEFLATNTLSIAAEYRNQKRENSPLNSPS